MTAITGAVIIGRNEGDRLKRCITSVLPYFDIIVYVDSGSTDQSIEYAAANGCAVVELDPNIQFSAARARNEGYKHISRSYPNIEYVQFIDGDCELQPDWLQTAKSFLVQNPVVAIVCGRRRERFPEKSVYNQLCDWEWAIPVGEIAYCGGDVLVRAEAFSKVDGYRSSMIAGEEPELCVRLRNEGWKIYCIDCEMTRHDASMFRFSQWWQRAKRSGYAYASGVRLHGRTSERMWVRQSLRSWIWALGIPLVALLMYAAFGWWGFAVLLAYPIQGTRQFVSETGPAGERAIRSLFDNLARFPELAGQVKFIKDMVQGQSRLIEYK